MVIDEQAVVGPNPTDLIPDSVAVHIKMSCALGYRRKIGKPVAVHIENDGTKLGEGPASHVDIPWVSRERCPTIRIKRVVEGIYVDQVEIALVNETQCLAGNIRYRYGIATRIHPTRSEEHTSELQSHSDLVCRLLLENETETLRSPVTRRSRMPRSSSCTRRRAW